MWCCTTAIRPGTKPSGHRSGPAQFADGLDGYLRRCIVEYPFVTAPWRYAVRRQFLMEQGLWFHEGIYHEDCEWCPKVLARAKTAAVCEQALYVYRDAPEQGRDSTCMNPARWPSGWTALARWFRP